MTGVQTCALPILPAEVTIAFKPTHLPTMGAWNLLLCFVGVAILIAIVVVNLI